MMILSSSLKIAMRLARRNGNVSRNARRDHCNVILTFLFYLPCLHHPLCIHIKFKQLLFYIYTYNIHIYIYIFIYTHLKTFSILCWLESFTHKHKFQGFNLYNFNVKCDRNLLKIILMIILRLSYWVYEPGSLRQPSCVWVFISGTGW